MVNREYNPDVLNCIANLSNDEVFTPPVLANQVLDMLPQELFLSPDTTFLDPFCKSGVFLREIVKRLDRGLASKIPNRQKRIDHIMHHQVYGIALTELTSLLSRRTLYCSKQANSDHSVSYFESEEGHIQYRALRHTWINGKCRYCGINKENFKRSDEQEQYAYEFIHTDNPKKIFNMKFDVIIGNPPYQLNCSSENSNNNNAAFASAIYPIFIEQAKKLSPTYLVMITPSRWMTKTGQGISDAWVDEMISSNHFKEIHDFVDSNECFAGVDIMGGVSYFLYQESYKGRCRFVSHYKGEEIETIDYLDPFSAGVVVRDVTAKGILSKVIFKEQDYYKNKSFANIVSPLHFYDKNGLLSSNWDGYTKKKDSKHTIKIYLNKRLEESGFGWVEMKDIPKCQHTINYHKVFIPEANGSSGENAPILGNPFYGEPGSVCSQTYLVIGFDQSKKVLDKMMCENIISYIKTKFFRYMVSIKKRTQHAPNNVYQFVPLQDFSHPWTDEMLYKKYKLDEKEIAFIESMIRPME